VHEIKHDGYRLIVRRGAAVRLFTRRGHDWTDRYLGGKTEIITTANLWMPYAGGSERYGIKKFGSDMTVGEFLRAAENARLTPDAIAELATPRAN
jgi:hypothetical protein